MPTRPLSSCVVSGCHERAIAHGRCAEHAALIIRPPDLRPSASQRGYGYAWQKLRAEFLYEHPICVICGRQATDVDHIIPRGRGGSDDHGNLQSLCEFHHKSKTATQDGGGWQRR
jgi:5-methylcytosine-specific restriction enzyme A